MNFVLRFFRIQSQTSADFLNPIELNIGTGFMLKKLRERKKVASAPLGTVQRLEGRRAS